MTEHNTKPVKLAFHAMDSRCVKTMISFLQGPCEGAAVVVNTAEDADVDVYDADAPDSRKLIAQRTRENRVKPAIVLSLDEYEQEGVLHLKKPIQTDAMLHVLEQAKTLAGELINKAKLEQDSTPEAVDKDFIDFFNNELFNYISSTWVEKPIPDTAPQILRRVDTPKPEEPDAPETDQQEETEAVVAQEPEALTNVQNNPNERAEDPAEIGSHPASAQQVVPELPEQALAEPENQELKTFVSNQARTQKPKHQTAMLLDKKGGSQYIDPVEKDFDEFVGAIDDIGVINPKQFINADYNPNDYFQGYFQYVLTACRTKKQPIMLQSAWCPIALFPYTQEVWLDAGDSELKAFAEIRLKHKTIASEFSVVPIDPKTMNLGGAVNKFQNMDSFLWKLACWTSKGRYPQDIDYKLPVYLSHWPNFTRLLITPHALRIAALLIRGPRTMINVAETLHIKPEFVFVFISAAYALGLAGQARRLADNLVQPPEITPSKGQELLGRFINRLRNNKP